MFRFLAVMALVYGAYAVGEHDAGAMRTQVGTARVSTMGANDAGIPADLGAIVRDGVSEMGSTVEASIKGAATQGGAPNTDALADDMARTTSRIARRVAGEAVIRICPSLGLSCGFPRGP